MNKFFLAMGVLALTALTGSSVEAAKGGGSKGGSSSFKGGSSGASQGKGGQISQAGKHTSQVQSGKIGNQSGKNGLSGDKGKAPYGKSFTGKNGKSYNYTHCPSNLHCKHYGCSHWNHYCWFGAHNCCGYFCPVESCWFFWYEPFYCYLPVQYIDTYRPVEVAPVSQVVNVNTNTNTNVNDNAAPAGPPALPPGATDVPADFTPPAPNKE